MLLLSFYICFRMNGKGLPILKVRDVQLADAQGKHCVLYILSADRTVSILFHPLDFFQDDAAGD